MIGFISLLSYPYADHGFHVPNSFQRFSVYIRIDVNEDSSGGMPNFTDLWSYVAFLIQTLIQGTCHKLRIWREPPLMRIDFDPRVSASNILIISHRTCLPPVPTQHSSQLVPQFVGSISSSESPCDLPSTAAVVLRSLGVAIVVIDWNGHISRHMLRLIVATISR